MIAALLILATATATAAGPTSSDAAAALPVYRCAAATQPVTVDGKLDDAAWSATAWTSDFVPLRAPAPAGSAAPPQQQPPPRSRAKLLWDARHLYVAAELAETDVRAAMRAHDAHLYREGAFELFIDPDDDAAHYLELQVNPLNTTFDLRMTKPYARRGKADEAFEIAGLRTAVHVDGTLNDPADADRSWTVEIAIPWAALKDLSPTAPTPPAVAGARWRVNMARVMVTARDGGAKSQYLTWSPINDRSLHVPARWGWVQFEAAPARGRAGGG